MVDRTGQVWERTDSGHVLLIVGPPEIGSNSPVLDPNAVNVACHPCLDLRAGERLNQLELGGDALETIRSCKRLA